MRALVASVAFALGGCALLVSTSDLSGGAASTDGDAAAADAGGDAIEGPAADGGGTDGSSADGGRFCEGRDASFCADFDEGVFSSGFTGVVQSGGTFELVPDAVTAPFALRSSVPVSVDSAKDARVWWQTNVPSTVRIELDARFDAPVDGYYEWLKLEFPTPYEDDVKTYLSAAIELGVANGGFQVGNEGWDATGTRYHTAYGAFSQPVTGAFTHVQLDVTVAESGSLRIAFDGIVGYENQALRTLPDKATAMRVVVGTFADKVSMPIATGVDDVVIVAR